MNTVKFILFTLALNIKNTFLTKLSIWLKIGMGVLKFLMFALAWKPFYSTYQNVQGWSYEHHLPSYGWEL